MARTKAYQLRMLVLSPWARHPSLLVNEAKTGCIRHERALGNQARAREGRGIPPFVDTPGGCVIFGERSQARHMQALHGEPGS